MNIGNGSSPAPVFVHPGPNADRTAALPKRFYKEVTVVPQEDGFAVRLDGRATLTPARKPLSLPSQALADAVAAEWVAIETVIDPRVMPFTRLCNSAIDGVGASFDSVLADVTRYAGSDLLVYRAGEPQKLVDAQAAVWDPVVAWSRDELRAPLILAEGVMFVAQPEASLQKLGDAVRQLAGEGLGAPFRLAALHVMTTLTSSVLLALAVAARRLTWQQAWAAAHVDEDHQISEWGADEEAAERRARREIDMQVAAEVYRLSSGVVETE